MRTLYCISIMFFMLGATILEPCAAEHKSDRPSRFVISSSRPTYVIAEPITLSFDLLNDSRKALKGYYFFDLEHDRYNSGVTITYQRKGDLPHDYALRINSDPVTDLYFLRPMTIPPHGRLSTLTLLLYDRGADRFVLDEPGTYEFRAKFEYDPGKTIESNQLLVTVSPLPKGESPEALAIWKDADLARTVQGYPIESSREAEVIERLSTLVKEYPSSVYTKDAREAIVNRYQEGVRLGTAGPGYYFQVSLLELVKLRR